MKKTISTVACLALSVYASVANARPEELAIGHTQNEVSYMQSTFSAPGSQDLEMGGVAFHFQGANEFNFTMDFDFGISNGSLDNFYGTTDVTWLFGSLGAGYFYELPLLVPVDIVAKAKYRSDHFTYTDSNFNDTTESGGSTEIHVGLLVKPFEFLLLEATVDKVGIIDADYSGTTISATLGDGGGLKVSGQSLKDGDNKLDIIKISFASYF